MADSDEAPEVSDWQRKVARTVGPLFLVLGSIALVGSWAITDPTVEKINMIAGALVCFGLFAIMQFVSLQREIGLLKSELNSQSKAQGETGSD